MLDPEKLARALYEDYVRESGESLPSWEMADDDEQRYSREKANRLVEAVAA